MDFHRPCRKFREVNFCQTIFSKLSELIYRAWDQTNLVLNSIGKIKPRSLISLMCMFPKSNRRKFWSHSFHLQNSEILQTRMDQRWDPVKTNFDIFQIQKWASPTLRAQKVDEKNGDICLVSFFPSWVMALSLPKIVHFLQICSYLSKESKSIKATFLYSSEHLKDLIMIFQKIVCFIEVWATVHEILKNKI